MEGIKLLGKVAVPAAEVHRRGVRKGVFPVAAQGRESKYAWRRTEVNVDLPGTQVQKGKRSSLD
jgi:hypothetical protein